MKHRSLSFARLGAALSTSTQLSVAPAEVTSGRVLPAMPKLLSEGWGRDASESLARDGFLKIDFAGNHLVFFLKIGTDF
jgi:hypothetical protein